MSKKRTTALAASVLSALLAGGVAIAPVASAEPEDSAYALAADGLVNITKTPHVVGNDKDHLVAADLPPGVGDLLHTGVFNSFAEEGRSEASTTDLGLGLSEVLPGVPELSAGVVKAECTDRKGSTSITDLKIGAHEIDLDQIEPNTTLVPDVLEGLAQITLNKQEEVDDMLRVSALSVELLDNTQNIDLSVATCGAKPPEQDDDNDDNDDDCDRPDEDGKAPVPEPQPGHLDVTG